MTKIAKRDKQQRFEIHKFMEPCLKLVLMGCLIFLCYKPTLAEGVDLSASRAMVSENPGEYLVISYPLNTNPSDAPEEFYNPLSSTYLIVADADQDYFESEEGNNPVDVPIVVGESNCSVESEGFLCSPWVQKVINDFTYCGTINETVCRQSMEKATFNGESVVRVEESCFTTSLALSTTISIYSCEGQLLESSSFFDAVGPNCDIVNGNIDLSLENRVLIWSCENEPINCPLSEDCLSNNSSDLCDCTGINYELSGIVVEDKIIRAKNYINSNEIIQNGTAVDYSTENQIILLPGMHIKVGSTFAARIEDCQEGSQLNAEKISIPTTKRSQNIKLYPIPFQERVTISFRLEEEAEIRLDIYDMMGAKKATLVNGDIFSSGLHEVVFNAKDNDPAGMYVARLQIGNQIFSKRMVLSR